jgi:RHS repeat-associated protein
MGPFTLGYDEFNRLNYVNRYSGVQTFTNVYDRYGNRWQQEAPQGGSGLSVSFNQAKNQINSAGFSYNAAGDLTGDGFHSYSYDAEGNLLQVDAGSTATYVYDALNHRVRTQDGSGTNEYLYDPSGKRISTWVASNNYGNEGRIYWGNQQLGLRSSDGTTYFDHQDWTGTERARTNCFGTTSALYASFVYGDDSYAFDIQNANSGYNQDNAFYAGLDYDAGSGTDHAMFRQYTPLEGRWMSPDPYSGSYNTSNPQSFNRYSYVTNNPAALTDPTGLDGGLCSNPLLCVIATVGTIIDLEWLFSGPSFHGTLSPRPSTSNSNWDGNFGESLGIPTSIPQGNFGLGMALGLPSQGCEFGACAGGVFGFGDQQGQAGQDDNGPQFPYLPPWLAQNRNQQGRPPGRPTPRNIPTGNPGAEPQLGPTNEPPPTNSGRFWYTLMQLRMMDNNINPPAIPFIVNPCVIDPTQPYCHRPYNGPA